MPVDPKGILGWTSRYIEKKVRPKAHVIEVLTEEVSIFEKPDFLPSKPAAFELKEVKQLEGSCLWLRADPDIRCLRTGTDM